MVHPEVRALLAAGGLLALVVPGVRAYRTRHSLSAYHLPAALLVLLGAASLFALARMGHGLGLAFALPPGIAIGITFPSLGMTAFRDEKPLYPIAVLVALVAVPAIAALLHPAQYTLALALAGGIGMGFLTWYALRKVVPGAT